MNHIPKKRATTGVIPHDGKFLIGLRKKDELWELPGGKIEEQESPQDCIVREIREELGIQVEVEKLLCEIKGTFRNIPMHVFAFLLNWGGGELKTHVHRELAWVTMQDIARFPFVEEDLVILKKWWSAGSLDVPG